MKFTIEKQIKDGKYKISITFLEITEEEKKKISQYGIPLVSIDPQRVFYKGRTSVVLPMFELGSHVFSFNTEAEASNFAENIRKRIQLSIIRLKSHKDSFSSTDNYEI